MDSGYAYSALRVACVPHSGEGQNFDYEGPVMWDIHFTLTWLLRTILEAKGQVFFTSSITSENSFRGMDKHYHLSF